ncbi:MAG TPA: OprD family outer membrane porin [Candidatus Baltobacteraceae bacterium]
MRVWVAGLAVAVATLGATPAPAPSPKIAVSGRVRAYNFTRSYRTGAVDTQAASIALKLHVETAPHDGLGAALTYYSANPFSNGAIAPNEIETSLPGTTLNTLAEIYVQYRSRGTLVRLGRQTLQTPFANPADSRTIPVTYEGVGATQALARGWTLAAYRIDRVKNRTAATFTPASFVTTVPTGGFAAFGLVRASKRGTFQAWA